MSRSRPDTNQPNPATRWYEWNGEKGQIRYYDKTAKRNVEVETGFTFLLLDQLGSVGGWHKRSDTAIWANAVKDLSTQPLTVRTKTDGIIASGLYKQIKADLHAVDGHFETQLYLGYKAEDGALSIGCLRLHGAALHAWAEFAKAHRAAIYEQATTITGYAEGTKGRIVFRTPTFALKPVSDETQQQAVELDEDFQAWLDGYLAREAQQAEPVEEEPETTDGAWTEVNASPRDEDGHNDISADEIPF